MAGARQGAVPEAGAALRSGRSCHGRFESGPWVRSALCQPEGGCFVAALLSIFLWVVPMAGARQGALYPVTSAFDDASSLRARSAWQPLDAVVASPFGPRCASRKEVVRPCGARNNIGSKMHLRYLPGAPPSRPRSAPRNPSSPTVRSLNFLQVFRALALRACYHTRAAALAVAHGLALGDDDASRSRVDLFVADKSCWPTIYPY